MYKGLVMRTDFFCSRFVTSSGITNNYLSAFYDPTTQRTVFASEGLITSVLPQKIDCQTLIPHEKDPDNEARFDAPFNLDMEHATKVAMWNLYCEHPPCADVARLPVVSKYKSGGKEVTCFTKSEADPIQKSSFTVRFIKTDVQLEDIFWAEDGTYLALCYTGELFVLGDDGKLCFVTGGFHSDLPYRFKKILEYTPGVLVALCEDEEDNAFVYEWTFTVWSPAIHKEFPEEKRDVIREAFMVLNKLRLPKDLNLAICSLIYVSTFERINAKIQYKRSGSLSQ